MGIWKVRIMKELLNVEVFAVGTWNGMKFVESDLEEIASNTNKLLSEGKNKPPFKLGHSKKQVLNQNDGQPALGWVENFRTQGKKLIADIKNIPDIVHQAISNKLYKTVSIELKHLQNFGFYAVGLATLGADLPAVKTLGDLELFLSDSDDVGLVFSEPTFLNNIQKDNVMPDDNKEMDSLKAELEAMKKEKILIEAKNQEFKEREKLSKFSDAKEKFLSVYKEDVKAGKLTPATLIKIEQSVDNQLSEFSETEELRLSGALMHEIVGGYKSAGLFSEQGVGTPQQEEVAVTEDVDQIVVDGINKVMANTGKSYSDSSELFFSANPEIAKSYKEFGNKVSNIEV